MNGCQDGIGRHGNRVTQEKDRVRPHEFAFAVWIVRGYRDVGVLRVRKPQSLVYPGLRGLLRVRIGLRIPARGLAIRIRRGGLDGRRCPAMVEYCGKPPMNRMPRRISLCLDAIRVENEFRW
jgi:hypothetical protein